MNELKDLDLEQVSAGAEKFASKGASTTTSGKSQKKAG